MTRVLGAALCSALILATSPLDAQPAPARQMQGCAAMNCEADVVRSVALDSVVRWLRSKDQIGSVDPLVLSSSHAQPFRGLDGVLSPPIERMSLSDLLLFRRSYRQMNVVDSAGVVAADGVTLRGGGPLFVLAPVSWRGESSAVVRLAVYPRRINFGSEVCVRLEYRNASWQVVRIEYGMRN